MSWSAGQGSSWRDMQLIALLLIWQAPMAVLKRGEAALAAAHTEERLGVGVDVRDLPATLAWLSGR